MLLLIDNYDSFTYNLARYFIELGEAVRVVRNDQISCEQIAQLNPEYLVLSPGPCTPNESGITLEAIKTFSGKIPILGVCLGHQAIGQVFGAKIIPANKIKHGKTSTVFHNESSLFKDINQCFNATRYHSLTLEQASLPECFSITAWCYDERNEASLATLNSDAVVMAIEHKELPIFGVQFHPESLLTEYGHKILENFIDRKDSHTIF